MSRVINSLAKAAMAMDLPVRSYGSLFKAIGRTPESLWAEVYPQHVLNDEMREAYFIRVSRYMKSEQVTLFPSAYQALEIMQENARLVVVTNKPLDSLHNEIEQFNLSRFFLATLSGCDYLKKPNPDMILTAQEMFPSKRTYLFGDTYADKIAAERAGCAFLRVSCSDDYTDCDIMHCTQQVLEYT